MKIAVPTNDGASISEHFGRSAGFLIFDVENGQIKRSELKGNGATHAHAQGECHHDSADNSPHRHTGILATLEGCEVVICAGMGQGAAEALKSRGIQIVVTSAGLAQDAVSAYSAGKLTSRTETFCQCHHGNK